MGDEFKFHLVNWDSCCAPICHGGLGIKKLTLFNQALLGKWLWWYGSNKSALWRRIIELKYGSPSMYWCSREARGSYGVGLWKYIHCWWGKFVSYIRYDVGCGTRVQFWHDLWGKANFKDWFPGLYLLAQDSEATVADYVEFRHDQIYWHPVFNPAMQDWEEEAMTQLWEFMGIVFVLGRLISWWGFLWRKNDFS